MKRISSLILVALTALFIISCKKDDPACGKNMTSIAKTYKITAAIYKATPASPGVDYFSILFPDLCDRDNLYIFLQNGTYQIKDIGLACSPSGDDNGTWSIAGDVMIVDGDATILESFDCNTLVISNTDAEIAGDKLTLTLRKQ